MNKHALSALAQAATAAVAPVAIVNATATAAVEPAHRNLQKSSVIFSPHQNGETNPPPPRPQTFRNAKKSSVEHRNAKSKPPRRPSPHPPASRPLSPRQR